jgi:hypothetical protein
LGDAASETCHNKETTQECRVKLKEWWGGILKNYGKWVQPCILRMSRAASGLTFGACLPPMWALPILKHKGKAIINLNICSSEGIGRERFLHLFFRGWRDLMHTSRCKE